MELLIQRAQPLLTCRCSRIDQLPVRISQSLFHCSITQRGTSISRIGATCSLPSDSNPSPSSATNVPLCHICRRNIVLSVTSCRSQKFFSKRSGTRPPCCEVAGHDVYEGIRRVGGQPASTTPSLARRAGEYSRLPQSLMTRFAVQPGGNAEDKRQHSGELHPRSFSIMSRYRKIRPVGAESVDVAAASDDVEAPNADDSSFGNAEQKPFQTASGRDRHRLNPIHGPGSITRGAVPLEAQFSSWEPPPQPESGCAKSLRIALIGPPNAGKSSLLNALLGQKLSAVSPKVNTTRSEIRGIITQDDTQLVFLDVPGIVESHRNKKFCRELVSTAWRGFEDADVALLVIDAVKRPTQEVFNIVTTIAPKPSLIRRAFDSTLATTPSPITQTEVGDAVGLPAHRQGKDLDEVDDGKQIDVNARGIPVFLCINKVDLASHPKWVYARAKEFQAHGHFEKIFHLSAKNSRGLQPLLDHLVSRAKRSVWAYPPEMKTTLPKVQQVAELIKTYLFCWFNKDVPYRIEQQTIGWTPRFDGSLIIEQELLVKDDKVAKMVCGVRNRLLFQLRRNVSHNLEYNWGQKVILYIHVKALRQRSTPT
ncbi:GTPase [Toxoplasma gondii ME49]|uniref:GTPase n=1 Tax=Toxoplasma gondii (strain ATCC 50611 / Me49) TaxID=508771 RepID=S8FBH4_TOXGM|nr:GTPase [Toxoplasma gondii ME49]EPT31003.1 GTPase [Toxoplasma gondii ME49]|eukprot:XP_018637773.1 GTPase [Toxoplasma gondii ME49]